MRDASDSFKRMGTNVPADFQAEINLSFSISNRLDSLMRARGLSKKLVAEAIGECPNEVTHLLVGNTTSPSQPYPTFHFFVKPILLMQ